MAACEKCWNDAYVLSRTLGGSQADRYQQLLKERKDNPCTSEQQRGEQPKDQSRSERNNGRT